MRKFLFAAGFALLGAACFFPAPSLAQQGASQAAVVGTCGTASYTAGQNRNITQDTSGNACSAASVSASISGFTAASTGTPISATTGGATGSLPAGAVVVATNVGTTNAAYCALGASASTSSQYISPGGGWFAFTVGGSTQLTCVTSTSTTTVNLTGGTGLPTGTGGGSGSGGGGGSNPAASATGSAVPSSASYSGLNVGGTLRGQTAVNPTGSVYAAQNDISSVAGTTATTGAGAVGAGSQRVAVGQDTTTVAGAAPTTTGIYVTGPSAAALATSALQTTGNTSLSTIATNSGTQATAANQTSVIGTKNAGTAATNSQLVGCVYNSSPLTLTTTQQSSCQADANGYLKVNVAAGGGSGGTSSSYGSAFPSTGTAIGASDGTNMQNLVVDSSKNLKVVGGYAQGSTTSGQTQALVAGAVTTSAPTYTNAQTSPLSLDTTGALRVNVTAGGGTGGTSVAQGSTTSGQNVSPAGCATTTSAPTNTTAQTNMLSCDTAGSLRVNVTSATGVAQGSTTSGQSVSPIGCRTLTSAPTDTTAQTNMPRCDTSGNLTVNCTTGCSSPSNATKFALTAAASTNATNIKSSAGSVQHVSVYNNSATLAWVSFYNNSGTPTCGTGIVWQTMIPANSTSGAGAVEDFASGLDFTTGIGICVTTGIAGTGSVAASTYQVNISYK